MNIAISCVALFVISTLYAEPPKTPPDLTQDRTVDRKLTYNLGPTGLRGWIYTRAANFRESQLGRTTTASRQILVTHVGKDLPADGVMKVDDVILGVGGKLFADDARQTFWHAITEAEKAENKGVLKLTCWRDSKTEEVTLKLRVIGSYSVIAPYDCPKSKVIFADACKALEKEKLEPSWNGAVSGLALLGTGNPEYLPRVKELAMKIELRDGMVVWDWGYKNVFLCECYQVTRDKDVLPAIQKYMASFQNREYGHTGQGFSCLWGALGANAGGPAASAFVREATWHLDLVWRSEGSFAYNGGEQYGLVKRTMTLTTARAATTDLVRTRVMS